MITCDKCVESREGKGAVVYCYRRDCWVWADNRHGCKHGKEGVHGGDEGHK